MTDQTSTAAGELTAPAQAITPDPVAALRDHWTSFGYDPAVFDRAISGKPEPSTDAKAEGGMTKPIYAGDMGLTDAQRREMAEELIKFGVPVEQIEAALKADGTELPPDTRTDAEREYDETWGATTPDVYRIEYIGRLLASTDTASLAAFHTEATTWLSAMNFPAAIGASVIERAMDTGQAYGRMSEPGRQLWIREQKVALERMAGGPDQAAEKMTLAAKALARAPAGFTEELRKSGALHDAGMVFNLALQGERLAVRSD